MTVETHFATSHKLKVLKRKFPKFIYLSICFLLIFQQSGFAQIAAELNIAGYLSALHNSLVVDKFRPLHLRYLSYDSIDNNFKLLLDKGDTKANSSLPADRQELENTSKELLKYFFIGISLPNDSFWVNLRPDAEDNIIDERLAQTDVGKILLESDLQLKKDTAKFTSPETPEGRKYWDKLYKKAGELFGPENITIPTLTRPWIVPDEIIIRETVGVESESMDGLNRPYEHQPPSAYIYKATLKVMLEQDYFKDSSGGLNLRYNFDDSRSKALNEYSSQLIRELIIPKLTKEINTSKRYAPLRQVYYSLILAQWFKARNKQVSGRAGLNLPYLQLIDSRNLANLTSKTPWSKTTYFKEYQKSFKGGEYNIQQPIYTPYGQSIRSYFSGGMIATSTDLDLALRSPTAKAGNVMVGPAVNDFNANSSPFLAEMRIQANNPGEIIVRGEGDSSAVTPAVAKLAEDATSEAENSSGAFWEKAPESASGVASSAVKVQNPKRIMQDAGHTTHDAESLCLTPDSLIHLADGTAKLLIELKPGEYVLSLNEQKQKLEPHKVIALLDMGVKPVYRITTASGKTLKTTLNHPYLTKNGWRKLKDIKTGSDIVCLRADTHRQAAVKELLSAPVGVFSGIYAVNNNKRTLQIKTDTILADPESVGSWRKINQGSGEMQRVLRGEIEFDFLANAFLQLNREFFKFPFSAGGKFNLLNHWRDIQDNPNSRLIFAKGTRPNFLASSMPFLSLAANFGLIGRWLSIASISQPTGLLNTYSLAGAFSSSLVSTAQSKSHNEYVSKTKYLGEPFLSIMTPALKSLEKARPDFFASSGMEANFLMGSILTTSLSNALVNPWDFILLSPYNLKYNTPTLNLSRLFSFPKAEAEQVPDNPITSDLLWDKIVSIEPLGSQQVYDIEVEGTHNFVANGIVAHNTYSQVIEDKPVNASSPMAQETTSASSAVDIAALERLRQKDMDDYDKDPYYNEKSYLNNIFNIFNLIVRRLNIRNFNKIESYRPPSGIAELVEGAKKTVAFTESKEEFRSIIKQLMENPNIVVIPVRLDLTSKKTGVSELSDISELESNIYKYGRYGAIIVTPSFDSDGKQVQRVYSLSQNKMRIDFAMNWNRPANKMSKHAFLKYHRDIAIFSGRESWVKGIYAYNLPDKLYFPGTYITYIMSDSQLEYSGLPPKEKEDDTASPAAGKDLGKCLTPESLIHLANGTTKPLIELKPFTNLRGSGGEGDMVLSLNEETQRLEPHRVNALLDMGVKPVYRITTASGKTLKTTLNHPYLVKVPGARCEVQGKPSTKHLAPSTSQCTKHLAPSTSQWLKLKDIRVGDEIVVLTEDYLKKTEEYGLNLSYRGRGQLSQSLTDEEFIDSDNLTYFNQRRPGKAGRPDLPVGKEVFIGGDFFGNFGGNGYSNDIGMGRIKFSRRDNYRRPLFESAKVSERKRNKDDLSLTKGYHRYYPRDYSRSQRNSLLFLEEEYHPVVTSIAGVSPEGVFSAEVSLIERFLSLPFREYLHSFLPPADKKYTIPSLLSQDDLRLALLAYEPIISIDYLGNLSVYDIEVEGTHNFVAQGIVAHNTVIREQRTEKHLSVGPRFRREASRQGEQMAGGQTASSPAEKEEFPGFLNPSQVAVMIRSGDILKARQAIIDNRQHFFNSLTEEGIYLQDVKAKLNDDKLWDNFYSVLMPEELDWQRVAYQEIVGPEKDAFIADKIRHYPWPLRIFWENNAKFVFIYRLTDSSGKKREISVIWDGGSGRYNQIEDNEIRRILNSEPERVRLLNNILLECYITAAAVYPWRNFSLFGFTVVKGNNFTSAYPLPPHVGDQEVKALWEDIRISDPVKVRTRKSHISASFAHELVHLERDEVMGFGGGQEIVSQIAQFLTGNRIYDRNIIKEIMHHIEDFRKSNEIEQERINISTYDAHGYIALLLIAEKLNQRLPTLKEALAKDTDINKSNTLKSLGGILSNIPSKELEELRRELLEELMYYKLDKLLLLGHEAEIKLGISQPVVKKLFKAVITLLSTSSAVETQDLKFITQDARPPTQGGPQDLGQCLTPDSLIQLADGTTKPLIELKPFTNLRGSEGEGDMVLSLNESTGRLEPHRVNALLDMGVKPVYCLRTQSGKELKTTLNHPYLTKDGWRKLKDIEIGEVIAAGRSDPADAVAVFSGNDQAAQEVFFRDAQDKVIYQGKNFSEIQQMNSQANNPATRIGRITQDIGKIRISGDKDKRLFFNQFINFFIRRGGGSISDILNLMTFSFEELAYAPGAIGVNQKLHRVLSWLADKLFFVCQKGGIQNTGLDIFVGDGRKFLFDSLYIHPASHSLEDNMHRSARSFDTRLAMLDAWFNANMFIKQFFIKHFISLQKQIYHIAEFLSRQLIEATEAAENNSITVNSDLLWDKIVSIEPLGPQQVYDIEVQGTHNFVANGIVAHNTYQNAGDREQGIEKEPTASSAISDKGGIDGSASLPSIPQETNAQGGIDFRALPIVTRAMSNLSLNVSRIPLSSIEGINLDQELREIQRLVEAGITPSAERIKEYVQVSCLKGNPDMRKVVSCIADILRLEEERGYLTDTMLKDILVVLESGRPAQELKEVFTGANS